ncbi:hypothetical protein [Kitasatospora purpeofusca]|uniref:hypothetical protein n=1 Tax=Kitasatospora purpeofusca TaxID=67352 RepID=UPI0038239EFF
MFGPDTTEDSSPSGHSTSHETPGPADRRSPGAARTSGTPARAAHSATRAASPGGSSTAVPSTAPTLRPRNTPGSPST